MIKKIVLGLFVFSNLVLISVLWWQGSASFFASDYPGSTLIALGRLSGLLAELAIVAQLLLIGRLPYIEKEFGHDKLNRVHRYIGYTLGLFLLVHPLLIIFGYAAGSELGFWRQIYLFMTDWEDVLKAVLALLLFVCIIFISIPYIKKRLRYETWHFTHLLMYVGIIFVLGHQTNFGDFAGRNSFIAYWYVLNYGALGLVFAYRFLRPLYNFYKFDFKVEKVVAENPTVTSVYITGKRMQDFRYQAGQFANLTFLTSHWGRVPHKSGNRFRNQAEAAIRSFAFTGLSHPFSISVAPNGNFLRFSVKASGDFTKRIREVPAGTPVVIDGPLGAFTEQISHRDKYLFLAGGIGITPLRALIEDLSRKGKDMVLLFAVRTPEDLVFIPELETFRHRSHFIFSEISETESLLAETGYINEEKIRRLAADYLEREIYLCGPLPMMRSLEQTLRSMGVAKKHIHYEKFGY